MGLDTNLNRRRFIGALTFAAAQFGMVRSMKAQTTEARRPDSQTNTSFGPLKQIEAGLLSIGYAEAGPINGNPTILLHG